MEYRKKLNTSEMKKIIPFVIAALFIFASCDTNSGVSEAFLKYSHQKGVTSVAVPGWLIALGAKLGDLSDEEKELLESVDKVKVLSVEDDDLNAEINFHKEFQLKINKNGEYEELMTVNGDDESVTIFGKMDDDVIKEMIILVGGDENAMVYVKGEISPELINNAIDKNHPDKLFSFNF